MLCHYDEHPFFERLQQEFGEQKDSTSP